MGHETVPRGADTPTRAGRFASAVFRRSKRVDLSSSRPPLCPVKVTATPAGRLTARPSEVAQEREYVLHREGTDQNETTVFIKDVIGRGPRSAHGTIPNGQDLWPIDIDAARTFIGPRVLEQPDTIALLAAHEL